MKYHIFNFRTPLKVVRTVEATSKSTALARAGYTDGEHCAVPVRESAFEVDDQGNVTLGEPQKMELRPMEESFRRMGLSETAAKEAARGRETRGHSLESSFLKMGLSESSARTAAKGR